MPRVPVCFAAAVLLLSSAAAQAARVERVEIVGLDEEMTENVRVSLALYESIGRDISGRRMAYLLREAERETRKALEPFGYYSPTIDVQRDREGDVMSVRVVVDPGQPVRVRNSDIAIIGEGGSESIIHEAEHARHDAEDLTPSVTEVDREEYVDTMLDLEVDCEVARVEYIQEMREIDPSYASGNRSVETYEQAYDAAVADGSSTEEAEAAGHEAIKQLYLDGEYVQSSDEKRYDESYGEFWDSRN